MRIVITGTPGTGKSTIAPLLAKELNLQPISIRDIVLHHKLLEKNRLVDIHRLSRVLHRVLVGDNYLVEGHLACEIPIKADFVFVLRTNPSVLKKRMLKRRYGKSKTEQNMIAEFLDYCTVLANRNYNKPPLEVDTSRRSPSQCVTLMVSAIKRKKKKLDRVSYPIVNYLGLEK
jgi:adenylate kinase